MIFTLSSSSLIIRKEIDKSYQELCMRRFIEEKLAELGFNENSFLQKEIIKEHKINILLEQRFRLSEKILIDDDYYNF